MGIDRRRLLQYTGAGCALALLPSFASAATTLRSYQVQDSVALPRFALGDILVADTGVKAFAGNGVYLYPAWGQPRLYDVRLANGRLEFRNPGSGQLLWTQSAALAAEFAGRSHEQVETAQSAIYPALSVPKRPAIA